MENDHDIDHQIKEAELRKAYAEEQKINSERRKIDLERHELQRPYFKRMKFVQLVIGAVIGGIAFLGVLQTIIEPTYKRDIIQKELKIAKQEKELFLLNENVAKLITVNDSILDSIQKVRVKNERFLAQIKEQKQKSIEIVKEQLRDIRENAESEGIVVATIYFEYDKSSLQSEFKEYLQKLSKFLLNNSNLEIKILGYSSEIGPEAYNVRLSSRRATVVYDALVSNGVSPARISTEGMGESAFNKTVLTDLDNELKERLYEIKSIVKVIVFNNNHG
ncbi:OmpA family protein [Luteirhabdus pelagi]|uniref:OmpA family protein n=1 Tax=Luteirhabdus pelagi TaxID=2792783 RepID=UPI00193ACE6A|nr:OmpA family protein [Luteirhabdus pelagi]